MNFYLGLSWITPFEAGFLNLALCSKDLSYTSSEHIVSNSFHFPILKIRTYNGSSNSKPVDEIVWYDHLNERRLLSNTFLWYYSLYAVQGGSNFCV